jgi:hypothetical protein
MLLLQYQSSQELDQELYEDQILFFQMHTNLLQPSISYIAILKKNEFNYEVNGIDMLFMQFLHVILVDSFC